LQAFRALNQAIGRAIRHKHDFGAIVFLDHRFSQKHVVNSLSKWVRAKAAVHATPLKVEMAGQSLCEFFKHCEKAESSRLEVIALAAAVAKENKENKELQEARPVPMILDDDDNTLSKNTGNTKMETDQVEPTAKPRADPTKPDPALLSGCLASMLESIHSNLAKFPRESHITVVKQLTDALVAEFGIEVLDD
jgi:hypothetical protein